MKFSSVDTYLSAFRDWHLPICIAVFVIGTILQWANHLDMAYVAFVGTVLGAITGHAFSPAADQTDAAADEPKG